MLYLKNCKSEKSERQQTRKSQNVISYFSEYRRKVNATDNKAEDTVSFNFLNTFTYNPELSAPLTGNEMITVFNAVIVVRRLPLSNAVREFNNKICLIFIVITGVPQSSIIKVQLEIPHFLKIVGEALDIMFKQPSTMFITMKASEFLENGIQIDCNHTEYAAKVVCAEMRRTNSLKVMNPEKTILRFNWFDRVRMSYEK